MSDNDRINIKDTLAEMTVQQDHAQPIWLHEFGSQPEPIDWVVEGLLARGEIMVLYGDAGCGKSYVALNLAYSIASGTSWLGYKTTQGAVLVIDSENSKHAIHRRLLRIANGAGGRLNAPLAAVCEHFFDLRSNESVAEIERLVAETEAKLLLLDSLMDFLPGADENSVKDVLPAMQVLKDIARRYNCSIVLLHHSNKTGGYRGSSALKGAVDAFVQVEATDSGLLKFKSEKVRESAPFKFHARFSFSTELDENFELIPTYRLDHIDTAEDSGLSPTKLTILKKLSNREPQKKKELMAEAASKHACTERTAKDAIEWLARFGFIERTTNTARYAEYKLTTKGEKTLGTSAY